MPAHETSPSKPTGDPRSTSYDVVVIGGGQTGLAIGYHLKQQGKRFVILERAAEIAPAWRERWDSLVLFTPRRYDALPGLAFPGDPNTEPTRDEVITYLERYAAEFDLPVALNSEVRSVSQKDGPYVVELANRTLTAEQVVVATGPFQRPGSRPSPTGSRPRYDSCTVRRIVDRTTCRPAAWWSSAAATPATRSPRSSPPRARSCSGSAPDRSRCRAGSSADTSSGGSPPSGCCASTSIRAPAAV